MLENYNVLNEMDFMSIDAQGSEYCILENFYFNKFSFLSRFYNWYFK